MLVMQSTAPVLKLLTTTVQGLAQMHDMNLTPADVKLANMVMDVRRLKGAQGPVCKYVDFGMAIRGKHSLRPVDCALPDRGPWQQHCLVRHAEHLSSVQD